MNLHLWNGYTPTLDQTSFGYNSGTERRVYEQTADRRTNGWTEWNEDELPIPIPQPLQKAGCIIRILLNMCY